MYFWKQEIQSIDNNVITFTDWKQIEIQEENKKLFTEEPIGWSELQEKWIKMVADDIVPLLCSNAPTPEIIDIFFKHNVRLVDVSAVWDEIFTRFLWIKTAIDSTIEAKNAETIVSLLGKDNLDTFSTIFWATENAPTVSQRNVRIKNIFTN